MIVPGYVTRRSHLRATGIFASLLSVLCCFSGSAAPIVVHWQGGSGNWSDPNHWDGGAVPNNGGETTYEVVIDIADQDPVVSVDVPVIISGLTLKETAQIATGGELTVSGTVTNQAVMTAAGGLLRLSGVIAENSAGAIVADGGVVVLENSTLNGGVLRATDDAGSQVRFSGEVTLNAVPWEDPGAGEFQIYSTTTQFMGDYSDGLPSGYTLVIWSNGTHGAVQLTLPGGVFTNDGLIELRDHGGGYVGYPRLHWESSGTLAGSGEVYLSGAGSKNLFTGAPGVELTIGPDQWVHGKGEIQLDVVNQGLLESDVSGQTLTITGQVENDGVIRNEAGSSVKLNAGLSNTGSLELLGTTTLNGQVQSSGDLVAATGTVLRFSGTTVENTGHTIRADGGLVEIIASTINGGSLRVSDEASSQVRFSGDVTLNNVPWEDPGAGEFQIYSTTTQFMGDYSDGLPSGYTLVIWSNGTHGAVQLTLPGGVFTNDGLIELRDHGGGYVGYPRLHWESSGTLAGSGEVYLSGAGSKNLFTGAPGVELTIGPDQWVHGKGEIQLDVVNQGLLESDVSGQTLTITGQVENDGVIRNEAGSSVKLNAGLSNTGSLELLGTTTLNGQVQSSGDLVAATGTVLRFSGTTVENTGHTIRADGGLVEIIASTINGGSLRVSDEASSQVRFSGDVTLNNVPWEDPGAGEFQIYSTTTQFMGDYSDGLPSGYTLVIWSNGTHGAVQLTLPGGVFTNDGLIELRDHGGGYVGYPRLHWESSGTLAGSGEVYLSGAGSKNLFTGAPGVELTIGPDQWVHGKGEIQLDVVNQGLLESDVSGQTLTITGQVENDGVIRNEAGSSVKLNAGLSNTGSLELLGTTTLNGQVQSSGDLVAATGTVLRFSGTTVENTGHTIRADGGLVEIIASTINGGSLRVSDEASSQVRFSGDVTLNNVPWEDPGAGEFQIYSTTTQFMGDYSDGLPSGYTLVIWSNGTHGAVQLTLPGGVFTNDGLIELRDHGGGYVGYPRLHWESSGTLAGSGEVYLSGAGSKNLFTGAPGVELTIGPDQWVHGKGEIQLDVVNQGVLEADVSGQTLQVGGSLLNEGIAGAVNGGTFAILGSAVNEGTLRTDALSGGGLKFSGNVINTGVLEIAGAGIFEMNGDIDLGLDLLALTGQTVRISQATVTNAGHEIAADGGVVEIIASTINGGSLRVSDEASSQVRFSGDVTLNNVPWEDPGAGEFQIYSTTTQFMGDYSDGLPSGYTLVIWSNGTHGAVQLTLPGGVFTNDGLIELRDHGGGYVGYPRLHWESSGTLAGSGEVYLSGAGSKNLFTGAPGVELTIGPDQWVHGKGEIQLAVLNQGRLAADIDGQELRVTASVRNSGVLRVYDSGKLIVSGTLGQTGLIETFSGTVDVGGTLTVSDPGVLNGQPTGSIVLRRHFLGSTLNNDLFASSARLVFSGGGTPAPELSSEAFFIEAEDFNYDRGRHLIEADDMPYPGGTYAGLGGVDGIDYHQTDNSLHSDLYRSAEGPSVNVNIVRWPENDRGLFRATDNYSIGWNDPGEWYNYTRSLPESAPPYYLFARLSSGAKANALQVDEIMGAADTTQQTLSFVGEIRGPASGAWDRYRFAPLQDVANNPLELNWVGEKTLRVTILPDGDQNIDYLVFAPAALSGPAQLVETMGRDRGPAAEGFEGNFALGSVELTPDSHVRLIDETDNAEGSDPEALYVSTLAVSDGAILDLNGLNLYTRAALVGGAVQGGEIQVIPDSGPIQFAVPTPGEITNGGEIDEWTFFARDGRGITVVVNPGSGQPSPPFPPYLGYAEIQLLDPLGTVLATVNTSSSGVITRIPGIQLSASGIYRVRVRAAQGHETATGKYSITLWDSTATKIPLVFNDTLSGRIASPYAVDHWTFTAEAGQQIRLNLLGAAGGSLVFGLTGPDGWTGFSDLSGSSDLVTLPASGHYTLASRAVDGQYGGAYAFQLEETEQVDLELGVAYSGTSPGSGHARIFRIDLDENSPLLVTLDSSSQGNRSHLSARRDSPPTPGDYDYRSRPAGSADQQLLIPMATPGRWYVLLYTDFVPNSGDYTLLALASPIALLTVTPESHGNGADTTLALTGAGFDPAAKVDLVALDDSIYAASKTEVHSFVSLSADYDAEAVPAGIYTVRVTRADDQFAELSDAFEMVAGGEAELTAEVIVPARLGYHQLATLYIEYANVGEVAMPAPLFSLTATQNGRAAALLTLDSSRVKQGFWTTAIPEGFDNSVQFLATGQRPGWLMPGETGRVPVYWAGWQRPWDFSYFAFLFNLAVVRADNSDAKDWLSIKDQLRPSWVNPEAWDPIFNNLTAELGNTWGEYVTLLNENAEQLSELGQHVTDLRSLWGFEVRQAMGLNPMQQLVSRTDITVPTPGLALTYGRTYIQSIDRRYVLGPLGRGWSSMWSTSLRVETDGAVEITGSNGSLRRFEPDSRTGGYFSPRDERSRLSPGVGGTFILDEAEGTRLGFRSEGNLAYVEDLNGNRITAGYTAGRLSTLTHSAGPSLAFSYYESGRISTVSDSWERTITYEYDDTEEHLVGVQNYHELQTTYAYNTTPGEASEHALESITYPDGTHRHFSYDDAGRLATLSRDGGAGRITFGYNNLGVVTRTDLAGASSRFFYDAQGSLARLEEASGRILNYTFDDFHRVSQVTDASGRTMEVTSACCGVITSRTDELGHSEHFAFDGPPRRMRSSTDPCGNVTRYAFDFRGNATEISYPDQTQERFSYDAQGNFLSIVNRRGETTDYVRDDLGRVTSEILPSGESIDFSFDEKGNLLAITNAQGITRFEYDPKERLTKITHPNERFLRFGYDSVGRRVQTADHTGYAVNYTYDSAGRLKTVRDASENLIIAYTYDARGLLIREDRGNGTYTEVERDPVGRVNQVTHYAPDNRVNSRFDYTYDPLGRLASMSTLQGKWTYLHDLTDQLIRAIFVSTDPAVANQDLAYEYDAAGNRVRTIENRITRNHQVNSLNQYTTFGTETYRYDLAGNLIAKTDDDRGTRYEYDHRNRLVRAVAPDGTWEYEYDALGSRSAVVHDGQRTEYLADPLAWGVVVGEFTSEGEVHAQYAYGLGLVSRADQTGELYYDYDALGSTAGLTDPAGSYVNRYAYLPFGGKLQAVVTRETPYQFGGRYGLADDGSGSIWMRARFYDPDLGRFASPDPAGLLSGDSNLYRYVKNDVIGAIDPFGLAKSGGPNYNWSLGPPGGNPDAKGNTICPSADDCTITFDITNPAWPCIIMHELIHWANRDDWSGGDQSQGSCIREEIQASRMGQACAKRMGYSEYEEFQKKKADGLEKGYPYPNCDKKPGPRYVPPPPPGDPAGGGKPAAPVDPNAKTGPGGAGSGAHVTPTRAVPYRVEFENEPAATAPAQFVKVTDQLDANFDWDTFELTEIGFGDHLLVVPPNRQQFVATVPMTYNGKAFEVQIRVGLDLATGQIAARFMSIDPETDLPPDVLTGFLPPEDGTGRGQGHICYLIRPNPGLVTGTEIRNVAVIEFDFGETIATNQRDPHDPSKGTDPALEALVTIDAGPPSSWVIPLPAQTQGTQVRVSWAGQDEDGGSGVARYDIYVSDSGGNWTPWRTDVAETSGLFTGSLNHSYAFYSVARDWVGHEESPPTAADAVTTLVAQLPTIVFPQIRYSEGSIRISWPSEMEGFYLETADTLVPPIPWERVEAVPEADGDELTITIEASDSSRFYRLTKP